jgi:hypothetical protein
MEKRGTRSNSHSSKARTTPAQQHINAQVKRQYEHCLPSTVQHKHSWRACDIAHVYM